MINYLLIINYGYKFGNELTKSGRHL